MFAAWLTTQSSRNDPVGDLARDLRDDDGFRGRTVLDVRRRLTTLGACEAAHAALTLAAVEHGRRAA